jgi:hypothetical protein
METYMKAITYRELAEQISNLPEDRKDDTLTLFDPVEGEYYPACLDYTGDEDDILDAGHAVITIASET